MIDCDSDSEDFDPIVMVCGNLRIPLCGEDLPVAPAQGDYLRPAINPESELAKKAAPHNGWFRVKYICHDMREGQIIYLVEPGSP